MLKSVDLYLGVFLILSGFIMSLINLNSVVMRKSKYSSILLSENVILVFLGIAFLSRAIYSLHPENLNMDELDIEERMTDVSSKVSEFAKCGVTSVLLGYGPFIISIVNSFLSLVIDNYMHYQMIIDMKKSDEENNVQTINLNPDGERSFNMNKMALFFKQNFSIITIILQWIIPVLIGLSMLPMHVRGVALDDARNLDKTCITMFDVSMEQCSQENNNTFERKPTYPLKVYEIGQVNSSAEVNTILDSVLKIVRNYDNNSEFRYTSLKSPRKSKLNNRCLEICITDNKNLLVYMFLIAFLGYFIPITISTVILTKISVIKVDKPYLRTYVSRELLYNVLFWTPVMFDTFLSLILCSFSMHGVRTSMLHAIANVYQAIKNFMNTKYFKENTVVPV